jgi:hypothetical protein
MARSLPTGGGAFNLDPSPVQHESFDPLDKRFTIYRAPLRKAPVRARAALQDICRAGNQSQRVLTALGAREGALESQ